MDLDEMLILLPHYAHDCDCFVRFWILEISDHLSMINLDGAIQHSERNNGLGQGHDDLVVEANLCV